MRRILSLLMVVCMLLGTLMLVGCPSPDDGGTTTTTKPGGGSEQPSEWADSLDTNAVIKDLGANPTLTISYFDQYEYEIYAEEDDKDSVAQMIYKRNKKLEERFGATIIPDVTKGVGEVDLTSHLEYARNELRSMQPSFDLLAMRAARSGMLVADGYYRDWRASVPYARESIAAGDAWWPADMNKSITICGRQFVAVSDISLSMINDAFVILFNESLVDTNNIVTDYAATQQAEWETMYDIVHAGAWTLDALISMTKDFWIDNENAGTKEMVDVEDTIGFYNSGGSEIDNFPFGLGFQLIENDGVSEPQIWTLPATFDTIVNTLRSYFDDNNGAEKSTFGSYEDRSTAFANGRIAFMTGWMHDLQRQQIRGMEHNRSVLPYPKLNQDQTKYYTTSSDGLTMISVPRFTTGKRLKTAGAMVVALSAETHRSIVEPYYEMIVKHDNGFVNKAAIEMIDLIMEGRVYDLSLVHAYDFQYGQDSLEKLNSFLRYLLNSNTSSTASGIWFSAGPILQNKMRTLINVYKNLP